MNPDYTYIKQLVIAYTDLNKCIEIYIYIL